jgi:hypothetical protein
MRYKPETNQIQKNGKRKRIVIDVRKMRVSGDWITTTQLEVNYLKRQGEFRFYVKSLIPQKKELWPTLKLKADTVVHKWAREGNYSREQFVAFLKARGVQNAESYTIMLMTMAPENLEAA